MRVIAIQQGRVQSRRRLFDGSVFESAYEKLPVTGPVLIGTTGVGFDAQGDLVRHGGPDRATLMYAFDHYDRFEEECGMRLPYGSFAENLTVSGIDETNVAIGDVFRVGEALLEVSEPRIPCWKITEHTGIKTLTERVQQTGRIGFFLRTLRAGKVQINDPLVRIDRAHDEFIVSEVYRLLLRPRLTQEEASWLLACTKLSRKHRERIARTWAIDA